jgi:sugar lactone lactonase YvrE
MGIWDDTGGNWSAGYGYDGVTATVSSWTDTQIVITGFGGYYGYGGYYQYNNGDSLTLNIWNPATSRDGSSSEVGVSPSTCIIIVGGGPTTCSAVASGVPTITWATPAAITQGTPLSATQLDATASVPGTFVYTPGAGAVPAAGTQTLSVTFTPTDIVHWTSATATVTLVVNPTTAGLTAQYSGSPVTIPSVNVGSVSASPISLTFTMNTAGTLGSTLVVTQGATGLDFTDAGTGTCAPATTYSAGATCTIQVNFAPNYPGPRYGAAELFDSSGNLIANVYLQGTGVAPLVNFPSGTQSTLTTSTLQSPRALAADGNGNVYIADTINGRILKETLAAGGYTESSVLAPGGYVVSYGIAVDGAGSVYVSDTFNGRVLKETPAPGGGYTQSVVPTSALYDPYGVAVDGSGNVYIADNGNNRVLMETLSAGAYTESTIGSGFNGPAAVAVDGNGVVYIADGGNFRVVKETPVSGGYHQNNVATEGLTGDGEIQPTGIAVDAIGDVYISDQRYGVILKESPVLENGAYEASEISGSGLNQPGGVAIDGSGNLYIADTLNNRVVIEDLVDPPSLTFPTPTEAGTTDSVDGWEVVTLVNIGNAPLAVSSVNSPSNFPVLSNFSPCQNVPTTVGIGGLCYLRVTFNPQTSGNLTGTVRITDNTLNAASPLYATQSFSVSGTGGGNPFGHLDSALDNVTTSSQVGQSDSVVVRGWAADYIDGAPLSNVTVYIDGTSVGAPTLGIARKDVAAAKGPAYLDSGFQLSYSAAALALGSHAVTAIAIDSGGRSTTFGPVDITVAATAGPAPPTPPFGHIDLAVDSVTGSSTVGQSDSVAVKGWAADVIDGAPLSNVTVYIDGDILGTPTLGIARPDVAAAEGAAYLKSGYLMSFSAAGLALGSHAVTVTAIDSGGRSTTFGPVAYTVAAAAGAPPPFGHIDSAVDSVTGSSTVGQSNSVVVKGWVADAADGAPLSNVTVSIDGTSVGTPTMGIARSDVSAAEGAAYLHSGYELNYSAAGLSIGSHTVTVTAIDSLGLSKTFGPLAFTVAATAGAAPPAPPFGHLDSAVDSVTGSTSVSAGGYVRIVGWVADAVDGAPVSNVTVYIDGSSVGQPAPGQARPDVAAALGAAYYNSGYRFAAPVVALDVGSHSVTVTAIDSGGRSTTFGPLEFTVLP